MSAPGFHEGGGILIFSNMSNTIFINQNIINSEFVHKLSIIIYIENVHIFGINFVDIIYLSIGGTSQAGIYESAIAPHHYC
jgi:hypothetical protein